MGRLSSPANIANPINEDGGVATCNRLILLQIVAQRQH
jgi:hypothetical protein